MPINRRTAGFDSAALAVGIFGLLLLIGGVPLVLLGGSPYYLCSGLMMVLCLTLRRTGRRGSLTVYLLFLVGTALWSLWEVHWSPWALIPRVGLPGLLGLWLAISRSAGMAPPYRFERWALLGLGVSVALLPALAALGDHPGGDTPSMATGPAGMSSAAPPADADWPAYGGDAGGTRFSAATQLRPDNVANLEKAWTFRFGDAHPNALQVTPLKVGELLYVCDSLNRVAALDAETGKQKWRFEAGIDPAAAPIRACRGVGYYRRPGATGDCATRIFINTVDARLIAIDALTGRRCRDFGSGGQVDLKTDMGPLLRGYYTYNGAPNVMGDRVVLGATIVDNQMRQSPSGVIRAFDANSGKLLWAYDVARPDRQGAPAAGEIYTQGTPNSWGQMAYDAAAGLIYVPTGNAPPDYFGGLRRPFDDDISSSVLALDAATGRRRWRFQTVHNDLWDFDIGAQPVLLNWRNRLLLIQLTKSGQVFVLDRITGKPALPVRERPVPQSGAAPGEHLSKTQPFSVGMPSLIGERLTEAMMWGLTPIDQLWCRIQFRQARYEGPFTPPGLTPSLSYPGYLGGMDWGSASVDPQRGVLVTVSSHVANIVRLVPRTEADEAGAYPMGRGREGIAALIGINAQAGTPYGVATKPFLSPLDIPCQQPPWSRLNAIALRTRSLLWSRPLGDGRENGPWGIRSRLPWTIGTPALGGALVTAGGLTFVGASTDHGFRAFSTGTGRLLWEARLPKSGNATPMSYLVSRSGRQFVVVAAAGHKTLNPDVGDTIVAFALPGTGRGGQPVEKRKQ